MQRRIATVATLALALALGGFACDSATKDVTIFQTTLSGGNEVPPNGSAASGGCAIQIDGNRVLYSIDAHGLSNVTGAHIHIAPAGVNGGIRVVLLPFPGGPNFLTTPIPSVNGLLIQGSFGPSEVVVISFEQLLTELRNGNAYCNIHTSQFPPGEIRGQFALANID